MKILSFKTAPDGADMLTPFLRSKSSVVDETNESEKVFGLVEICDYDAVLLHLSEDRPHEVDLVRELHLGRFRTPIVAIARSMNEATRLRILWDGADDLIVNALSYEEIFLKVQKLIRLSHGQRGNRLFIGSVEINMNSKDISARGRPVALTKTEYEIVEILSLHKGSVLSKEQILHGLYGGVNEPDPKVIDVFICKIRKKLQSNGVLEFIETKRGSGYIVKSHHFGGATDQVPCIADMITDQTEQPSRQISVVSRCDQRIHVDFAPHSFFPRPYSPTFVSNVTKGNKI